MPLTDAKAKTAGVGFTYDGDVPGFAVRVTPGGHRSWVLRYKTRGGGVSRTLKIGAVGAWTVSQARQRARELRREVDNGGDPQGNLKRQAPMLQDLWAHFAKHHLPDKSANTREQYTMLWRSCLAPAFGTHRLADIGRDDIAGMQRRLSPSMGGAAVTLLSILLNVALRDGHDWHVQANPCIGIKKAKMEGRERFLSEDEIQRLLTALDESPRSNALRLLLWTGARKNEVLQAAWTEFDLKTGLWAKPSARTKSGKTHKVPLSEPALLLLKKIYADKTDALLFPGKISIDAHWHKICRQVGLSNFRIHDLRHTYASILVNAGVSLFVIGKLLGHSSTRVTEKYSHHEVNVLREATGVAASILRLHAK